MLALLNIALYNISSSDTIFGMKKSRLLSSFSQWSFGNFTQEQFSSLAEMYKHYKNNSGEGISEILRQLKVRLTRPGLCPEKDILLVFRGGEETGFAWLEQEALIKRAVLTVFILPQFKGREIFSCLLEWSRKRAREQGLSRINIYVEDEDLEQKKFLRKINLKACRRFIDMEIDLKMDRNDFSYKKVEKASVGAFKKGEEGELCRIQNEIFEKSWGFCPNTIREIKYYLELTGIRLNDVLKLTVNGKSTGYIWSHRLGSGGRIHMFGVLGRWRGKGLGKSLLSVCLKKWEQRKVDKVELTVDEENTAARKLYYSLGFKDRKSGTWYESGL